MTNRKLTTLAVENAKPKRNAAGKLARTEYPDAGCPGLYLVVQASKKKSWALRYRFNGHPCKLTFGRAATAQGDSGLTLAAARAEAAAARHDIARGIDPAASRRTVKAAPTAEDNVEAQAERFLDLHARRKLRPATLRQYESVLARLVLPKWRGRSVGDIKRRDVIALVEDIAVDRPIMANRCLGVISKLFSWLLARDVVAASPAHGVEMPGVENARERALDDAEVAALWQSCEGEGVFGAAVRVMMGVGARRSEVSGMRWDEIDPDPEHPLWMIPKERSKSKRALAVPLSTLAWKVINDLPRLGPYVFSIDGRGPVKNFIRVKDRLDAKLKFSERFVLHDLRRSCATGLQRLGIRTEVIEATLGHYSGSRAGIVGRYQRHDYSDERRDALQRWSDHIEQLISGKPATVVRFRSERRS